MAKIKNLVNQLQACATGGLFLAIGLFGRVLGQPVKTPPPASSDPDAVLKKAASPSEGITQQMKKIVVKPKVLHFYADWCTSCKKFDPVINEAKSKYEDKVDFEHVNIDAPENKELVAKYEVTSLPTTIYLDSDGETAGTMIGAVDAQQVRWAVNMLVMEGEQASLPQTANAQ